MELQEIVERYAEAFEEVDRTTTTQKSNRTTGRPYHMGLHSLGERDAIAEADIAWDRLHPGELMTPPRPPRSRRPGTRIGFPYPTVARTSCDHVFSTIPGPQPEWAIEAKYISFVGDNGKNNDYGVGKMLSPYLKDRGVLHDAARLRESDFSQRVAVVMYSFRYSEWSCNVAARLHPQDVDVAENIRAVIRKNGRALDARPVIEIVDAILTLRGFLRGPRAQADFRAWRHPAGGRGTVYGWEIRRPQLEPDFDQRHPW